MNLRQIAYAVAVAEEENFTRAAERCHTVQSALSHQIARLEEELGAQLFERSSRRVRLTPAGHAFLPAARQLLHSEQRIRDEVAAATGQIRGSLVVGLISALTVVDTVDLLGRFNTLHPRVDVRLASGMSENLLVDVREHRSDVAFVGLWPGERIEGLNTLLLADEALVAVMLPDHPLAQGGKVSLRDLSVQRCVDYRAGSGARRQTDEAYAAAGHARHVHFEVDHATLLERIVRRGLAIGMVPAETAVGMQGLAIVPVCDAPRRRVYCVWAQHPTPAAIAFIDMVKTQTAAVRDALQTRMAEHV
ncbi:DNA-binding transcriptional regulator, LysR family [Andreprevotia lacus DSM 23236]|jgi:DNA-binding transcriptional LysR family regulator|uniref:DNA-binding transcriptional regulator, LysR family n=1 Tax=Andreprevotia lacus DSM 23236 TaxID=1121001 RepID=A0A1W1XRH0_9NEIS|nr:LysR family transcriptional regulator [Andreprevotia lacus]SMC26580.1 DNA-binding transcriptional regulator, LysR family [Andreprevotia lacus DSM 23236]